MDVKPVLLMIFDGFGVNPSRLNNGWAQARTPHLDEYFARNPHTVLQASGLAVGLPDGQFGNSEVGHLTLGAGRILEQELLRIAEAIRDGEIAALPAWQALMQGGGRLHLVGLVSDGGVHSHLSHLLELLPLVVAAGIEPVIHVITDGRDSAPGSAAGFLAQLQATLQRLGSGRIATVCGRYWAMDRAGNLERTAKAWRAMLCGEGYQADSAFGAIEAATARGETDEFIEPTVIRPLQSACIGEAEAVLFFNFRSDRARQLAAAIGLEDYAGFDRGEVGKRTLVSMTQYDVRFPFAVLFQPHHPQQVLAQVISDAGLKQFHSAETEKFPHVTYFFNGGIEAPFPGEDREMLPSPKVATYDQLPQMSTPAVADRIIAAIESQQYHFILVNFANGDMVGHTGGVEAVLAAVECLDRESHRVIEVAKQHGVRVMLTADHGNCDELVDPASGEPSTQHSVYPVPFLLIGEPTARLGIGRGLADIAPTVLDLLGLTKPQRMTGRSLLLKNALSFSS